MDLILRSHSLIHCGRAYQKSSLAVDQASSVYGLNARPTNLNTGGIYHRFL